MTSTTLRADCARCAALCCVALAFDHSRQFAFDKRAGEACRHLACESRCAIYGRRRRAGMSGCVGYDCGGAGQYVTERMFAGRSWRLEPDLLRPMMEAFSAMREIHELAALLRACRALPLPAEQRERVEAALRALLPEAGWSRADVKAGLPAAAAGSARSFLASLRDEEPERLRSRLGREASRRRLTRRASA